MWCGERDSDRKGSGAEVSLDSQSYPSLTHPGEEGSSLEASAPLLINLQ